MERLLHEAGVWTNSSLFPCDHAFCLTSAALLSGLAPPYFQVRLAFTMAAFNVLVQWQGFQPTASGFVPLSMAEFRL